VKWQGIRGPFWEIADHIPDKEKLKSFITKWQREARLHKRLLREASDSMRKRLRTGDGKRVKAGVTVSHRSGRTLTKIEKLASIYGDKNKPKVFYHYALNLRKGNLEQALLLLTSLPNSPPPKAPPRKRR
jgi:hypothetical protein